MTPNIQDNPKAKEFIESRHASSGALIRRLGCFGWLLGRVIVAAALGLIFVGFDALESPWAYDFFGTRLSLTGEWVAEFMTPYGRPNTDASDVPLAFRGKPPFVVGYALQDLRGAWSGETLQLSDVLTRFTDTRESTIYNPNEIDQKLPTAITFHKGSAKDFAAACAKLAR